MEEETQHADAILKRILFLEGKPDMRPDEIHPGYTVPDMLAADLKLEYEVRENLASAIALCEKHRDYQTREILEIQLKDTEEDHAYWLEQQLRLIKLLGMENYLQSQM
jgi:bacterioferritin